MPAVEAVELVFIVQQKECLNKNTKGHLNTANIALTTLEEAVILLADFL
jgi:hypothetical protein